MGQVWARFVTPYLYLNCLQRHSVTIVTKKLLQKLLVKVFKEFIHALVILIIIVFFMMPLILMIPLPNGFGEGMRRVLRVGYVFFGGGGGGEVVVRGEWVLYTQFIYKLSNKITRN